MPPGRLYDICKKKKNAPTLSYTQTPTAHEADLQSNTHTDKVIIA